METIESVYIYRVKEGSKLKFGEKTKNKKNEKTKQQI